MDLLDFLFQFIKNNFSNTCFSQVLLKHIYIFSFNIYFTSVLLPMESALIMLRYLQVQSHRKLFPDGAFPTPQSVSCTFPVQKIPFQWFQVSSLQNYFFHFLLPRFFLAFVMTTVYFCFFLIV